MNSDRTHTADPMERALALADEAARMGEVPVGAVIVRDSDGSVVGEGYNRRETDRDPTAHAEIAAIRQAAQILGGWRLSGCTMYVTLEPCPMCRGAAVNARLDRVIYGASDTSQGSFEVSFDGGYMADRCKETIKLFFKRRRKMGKIRLVEAKTDDQFRRIAAIADEIWHDYFPLIIGEDQTDYMVYLFCSFDAMKEKAATEDYIYYFIKADGEDVGYTAIRTDGDRLFLSKLYLYKEHRGRKYAKEVMEILSAYAREHGLRAVWLTVNKHNDLAIASYEAMGFVRIGEGKSFIGNGFYMDDYYYELDVTKAE
ncbi:MAG: GNAT family N-acetyltransferase [Oscillospiraceae bacterium]|nr:GNAT family N-acetyltransferase [Oscillospiraceae bacterium]